MEPRGRHAGRPPVREPASSIACRLRMTHPPSNAEQPLPAERMTPCRGGRRSPYPNGQRSIKQQSPPSSSLQQLPPSANAAWAPSRSSYCRCHHGTSHRATSRPASRRSLLHAEHRAAPLAPQLAEPQTLRSSAQPPVRRAAIADAALGHSRSCQPRPGTWQLWRTPKTHCPQGASEHRRPTQDPPPKAHRPGSPP